jgi:hypothetical protein
MRHEHVSDNIVLTRCYQFQNSPLLKYKGFIPQGCVTTSIYTCPIEQLSIYTQPYMPGCYYFRNTETRQHYTHIAHLQVKQYNINYCYFVLL